MGFTFKRFHIDDDRCGMKVGTDSILLGSMVELTDVSRVLDIGSGSGLLSLMLAQRLEGKAEIVAVEIDKQAVSQAKTNIAASPWPNVIEVVDSDINQYSGDDTFELIISNPPYFTDSLASPDAARQKARHDCGLSKAQLAANVARLLSNTGVFWLILPPQGAEQFVTDAKASGLHCRQKIEVHTKRGKPAHRHILALSKIATEEVALNQIDVYDENNQYSRQFIALTQDFYLNR